jgi:hypothetical protein
MKTGQVFLSGYQDYINSSGIASTESRYPLRGMKPFRNLIKTQFVIDNAL